MARLHSHHGINTSETRYVKQLTAGWLVRLLEGGVACDEPFLTCAEWCVGSLKPLSRKIFRALNNMSQTPRVGKALKAMQGVEERRNLADELADMAQDHPVLGSLLVEYVREKLQALCKNPVCEFSHAKTMLKSAFGLSDADYRLSEFVFINQSYLAVQHYFEDSINIFSRPSRPFFATMLDMDIKTFKSSIMELESYGILNAIHVWRLPDSILRLWDDVNVPAERLFCRPLPEQTLDLASFSLPSDSIVHVLALMSQPGDVPVHILLYGPPGTGKTTFASSVAKALDVKAWAVSSRHDDDDDDRRASLTACVHLASKHPGAFVLLDEAERLLTTGMEFFHKTKDKAWLTSFMEQPGRRIIWITNEVENIDPAVRRRFSFSLHFDELSQAERHKIWCQQIARHRVEKRISSEQCSALAQQYPVPIAVMEQAILQAKVLYRSPKKFCAGLERILQAYATLRNNGERIAPIPPQNAYTLDGLCLDTSAHDLLAACVRVDSALRTGKLRSGAATLLFYGPPGTGKTALAHHIAQKLNRQCVVKRASDLLGPYVGMTEKRIAEAFHSAEHDGAVLVIDEVDTFLFSRETAQLSWESSMVNEFLTALENYRGLCICTTNRREHLDPAAMRRFSHKVAFAYAKPAQVESLYNTLLAPLCKSPLPVELKTKMLTLTQLTPGDFHTVRTQFDSYFVGDTQLNHEALIAALLKEQVLKTEPRRMGFA